jgi:hypothetical protein
MFAAACGFVATLLAWRGTTEESVKTAAILVEPAR